MIRCLVALLFLLAGPALAQTADFKLVGPLTQGGLATGQAPPGAQLTLNGQPVLVAPDGRFVIGFGREAPATATLTATLADGRSLSQAIVVAPRSFRIQRIDGLPPQKVTMSAADEEKHAREREQVAVARSVRSDAMHWAGGFVWPAKGKITGVYGSQRILNGEARAPHYGVDIAGPVGRLVKAPASGIVVLAEKDFVLEGGIIIIDHGFGVFSTLFHLNNVAVRVGQAVTQGEDIGTIGKTGRATGPHVDWRINWGDVRVDPALLAGPVPPG
jgi:murein DD-endopeptidase MepM/ murein hydrolase activator NlpD